MEFQKIVEELLDENVALGGEDKKKGIIAANFTTKTGLYASAQTGTSAGVLAPQFSTASNEGSRSFAERNNAGAEDDTTTTKRTTATKTNALKTNFKPSSKGGTHNGKPGKSSKNSSKGSKGTIVKYKPVNFGGEWKWS